MDIPYLGTLMIQNSIAGVKFFETLTEDLKEATTRHTKNIKENKLMYRTMQASLSANRGFASPFLGGSAF